MRCLFLPDNLFASIIEEQALFQGLLSFPFRKIFPVFKTRNNFTSIKIYPPLAINGFIVRVCNIDLSCTKLEKGQKLEGFVLGYAGERAKYLIDEIPQLRMTAREATFSILSSKSWYFADVEYKKIKDSYMWKIGNAEWQKQKNIMRENHD